MKKQKPSDSSGYLWYTVFAVIGNALNFGFNWYFLKQVPLAEFGTISFFSNVQIFLAVLALALQTTVSKFVIEAKNTSEANRFLTQLFPKVLISASLVSLASILFLPTINSFFQLGLPLPLLAILPAMTLSFVVLAFFRGIIAGKLQFARFGFLMLLDPLAKVLVVIAVAPAVGYLHAGLLSLPLALAIAAVVSWTLSGFKIQNSSNQQKINNNTVNFFTFAVIANSGAQLFITLDIFLVKALYTIEEAGLYAAVSLISKIVYYLVLLGSGVLIPLFLRNASNHKTSKPLLMGYSALMVLAAIVCMITIKLLPVNWLSALFGDNLIAITPLLPLATSAAVFISINTLLINHALANERYGYVVVVLASVVVEVVLFTVRAKTIAIALENILIVSLISFLGLLISAQFSSQKITPLDQVKAGAAKVQRPFLANSAHKTQD